MKYKCGLCDYITDIKSNYNRHLKSILHEERVSQSLTPVDSLKCACQFCGKDFTKACNAVRHEKTCLGKVIKIKELEVENKYLSEKMELENKYFKERLEDQQKIINELKSFIKSGKCGTTYNISVKGFVRENYPEAPALDGLTDYSQIKYDEHTNQKQEDKEFISTMVYNYNNKVLHAYLGDFIIKHYKKENPSQQSVWSSDTARLTYIIRELLTTNELIWNHDSKGVKTKKFIINPLLKYIRKQIDEFWAENMESYKHLDTDEIIKLHELLHVIYFIKKDIDNDIIASNIIKYMAPYFTLDDNIVPGNKLIE